MYHTNIAESWSSRPPPTNFHPSYAAAGAIGRRPYTMGMACASVRRPSPFDRVRQRHFRECLRQQIKLLHPEHFYQRVRDVMLPGQMAEIDVKLHHGGQGVTDSVEPGDGFGVRKLVKDFLRDLSWSGCHVGIPFRFQSSARLIFCGHTCTLSATRQAAPLYLVPRIMRKPAAQQPDRVIGTLLPADHRGRGAEIKPPPALASRHARRLPISAKI